MASLTLKNVPDELLRDLRSAAERDRRSVNQEIQHLLVAALGKPAPRAEAVSPEVAAQVAAWRELAGVWESDLSATEERQQLARRRSRGRKVAL